MSKEVFFTSLNFCSTIYSIIFPLIITVSLGENCCRHKTTVLTTSLIFYMNFVYLWISVFDDCQLGDGSKFRRSQSWKKMFKTKDKKEKTKDKDVIRKNSSSSESSLSQSSVSSSPKVSTKSKHDNRIAGMVTQFALLRPPMGSC